MNGYSTLTHSLYAIKIQGFANTLYNAQHAFKALTHLIALAVDKSGEQDMELDERELMLAALAVLAGLAQQQHHGIKSNNLIIKMIRINITKSFFSSVRIPHLLVDFG